MNISFFLQLHKNLVLRNFENPLNRVIFYLLIPAACLYGCIGQIRAILYHFHFFKCYRSALPVLSVGNLAAGGTGKTPTVDWLVKSFGERGKKVAVLSRGYGGQYPGEAAIVSDSRQFLLSADIAGDEPYLLAKKNPDSVVAIARKRCNGLKLLEQCGGIDLVILDDAFQHLAVRRDADLVLLDANFPLGNGWPIPAGNLREFSSALRRADVVLKTRASELLPPRTCEGLTHFFSQHQLADYAISLSGKTVLLEEMKTFNVAAFSGIADPEGFFKALENKGICLRSRYSLPDHVHYDATVCHHIAAMSEGVDLLLTTEKDAVKLDSKQFNVPCFQVPLNFQVDSGDLLLDLLADKLWR